MKTLHLLGLMTVLLVALRAYGDDLPTLQSSQPAQLPSISTATFQPVTQDKDISTTCYLGNPNDRNSLGNIMVNIPESAGPTCNSMFYSCRGACFGCFSDFDLSQDICVDAGGKKFLW